MLTPEWGHKLFNVYGSNTGGSRRHPFDFIDLGRDRDLALDCDRPVARHHLEFEIRRGPVDRQIGPHPATDGQIVHSALTLRRELESRPQHNRGDHAASFFHIHVLKVEHEVVEGRIFPVHAVEKPGPLTPLFVHFYDVSDGISAAVVQPFLQHLDSALDGGDDPGPQDGLSASEQQVARQAVIDRLSRSHFLG
jgi:hypothetical protein